MLLTESKSHAGGSKPWPYMLQGGLTSKPSKIQRVHTRGGGQDGKVWRRNGLSKVTKQFSLLLDGKLLCSLHHCGHIVFWLRDQVAKFKTHQIKKYSVLAKIAKFNAHQISRYAVYPL